MHPELKAWRERNGRANRIGDCDEDGNIPDWAVKSFREHYPWRSGDFTSAPAGACPRGDHHSGGCYDPLGYWIPNRIS
jgi:hypothetical protein